MRGQRIGVCVVWRRSEIESFFLEYRKEKGKRVRCEEGRKNGKEAGWEGQVEMEEVSEGEE